MKLPNVRAITLRDTPDRTARLTSHLLDRGIDWKPFEGINAVRWGLHTLNTYEMDSPGSGYLTAQKHVGLGLGHYMLWTIQQELGHQEMTILEDDAVFCENWEVQYTEARKHLPGDWDIFMIGSAHCQYRAKEQISGPVWAVYWPITTHAYIVNARALPTLLRTQQHSGAPIDLSLALRTFPLMNVYTLIPRIADQHNTPLDD